MTTDGERDLQGWKQIAGHFDVSVRTAQLWEKERGMPVHRLPAPAGSGPARVFAFPSELDGWASGNEPGGEVAVAPASRFRARTIQIGVIAVGAAIMTLALVMPDARTGELESVLVEDDTLIARDPEGREAWRYPFETDVREELYESGPLTPRIADIDGDGQVEILVVEAPVSTARSQELVCLSSTGEELWRFRVGRPISTPAEEFEDVYVIAQVRTPGPDVSIGGAVAVVAHHFVYYPTQVVVLTAAGQVVSEYWHAGHLGGNPRQMAVADLDDDGTAEFYLSGVSNARRQATLVVLDPREMSGAATEPNDDYRFQDFEPGREIARLFFARSAVSLSSDSSYNVATDLLVGQGTITVSVEEDPMGDPQAVLHYRLGAGLDVEAVIETDSYIPALDKARRDGRLGEGPLAPEDLLPLVEIERDTTAR